MLVNVKENFQDSACYQNTNNGCVYNVEMEVKLTEGSLLNSRSALRIIFSYMESCDV